MTKPISGDPSPDGTGGEAGGDGHGLSWLVLLATLLPLSLPSPLLAPLLLVMPASFAWRWRRRQRLLRRTPLDLSILLLAIMMLVSLAVTFDIALSFPKIAGLVGGIALYYAVQESGRGFQPGWGVAGAILATGAAAVIVGLLGTSWTGPFEPINAWRAALPPALRRVPGTSEGLINPNELAGVLVWIVPLALAATLRPIGRRRAVAGVAAVLAIASAFLVVATRSRGAILSLVMALLFMAVIRFRRWRLPLLLASLAGIVLLITVGRAAWLGGILAPDGSVIDLSLEGRLEIWSRAIYGLQDFPLTGMSLNGFRRVVHVLYPLFLIAPDVDLGHAHNQLLQAGLDLGLPGLVAYLSIWFGSVVMLRQSWRRAIGPLSAHRPLILGLTGSLAAGWFFGLLDAIALGARPGFIWWLLLGLVALEHRLTLPTRAPVTAPESPPGESDERPMPDG